MRRPAAGPWAWGYVGVRGDPRGGSPHSSEDEAADGARGGEASTTLGAPLDDGADLDDDDPWWRRGAAPGPPQGQGVGESPRGAVRTRWRPPAMASESKQDMYSRMLQELAFAGLLVGEQLGRRPP